MSKESMLAQPCLCGQRIYFMEQHMPHCPGLPERKRNKIVAEVGEKAGAIASAVIEKVVKADKLKSQASTEERKIRQRRERKAKARSQKGKK